MKFKDSIIIILLFIIAVTLGIFVGFKISEKNKNGNEIDQGNISDNKNDENNNKQDYSLAEATKLMDNYVLDYNCGETYITDLTDETIKNYLSFKMIDSTETVACKVLENEGIAENKTVMGGHGDVILSQCILDEENHYSEHNLYYYDSALKNKKILFGDLSTLEKDAGYFDANKYFYYSTTKDGFVELTIPAGYGCNGRSESYGVISSELIGTDLKILAYNTSNASMADIEIKETVDYEYTFKMQDTGYYLASIEKVK